MIVLEARAAGAPVVCASTGGLPEMVDDGRDGLLVDPRDAAALAAAIERLIGNGGLRRSMALAGAERLKREHGPELHRQRLLAVYSSAISSRDKLPLHD